MKKITYKGTKYQLFNGVSTMRILIRKLPLFDPFDFPCQFYTCTHAIAKKNSPPSSPPIIPVPLNNRKRPSNRSTDRYHVTFR